MVDLLDLGRKAYQGYARQTLGKTWDGRAMPSWDDLGDDIRAAWRAAAAAVTEAHQIEARDQHS
jgi:hypothetical protein